MAYGERGAWNAPVYEAREEDYDFDQYGQPLPLAPPPPRPASDTPDAVYHDDNALLDCWAAALLEIKFKHPELFAPLQQAPLSLSQKRESAPLWYGPEMAQKTKPTANDRKRKATPIHPVETNKKSKSIPVAEPDTVEMHVVATPSSPAWTPPSPSFPPSMPPSITLPPPIALPPTAASHVLPPPHRLPPSSLRPSTALRPPSNQPLPSSNPPRTYPAPPPIVDIEPGHIVSTAAPEELLQDALWAWYNAGYQTALYHAAMGAIPVPLEEE